MQVTKESRGKQMEVSGFEELTALGTTELVIIGVLGLIQIVLLVAALVDIMRRGDEEVTGGKRWVWILVALFVNMIGPIVYFLVGRKPKAVVDPVGAARISSDKTGRALDALYGDSDEEARG